MYPNYTKTFLDLEGVSMKKVVQAESFYVLISMMPPSLSRLFS